ncbi:MAG: DUF6159 family protein [Thermoleophilia bacterium]
MAVAAIILGPLGGLSRLGHGNWSVGIAIAMVVFSFPLSLVGTFFGVAFVSQAAALVDGHPASVRRGLAVAWSRRDAIAWWALVSSVVGTAIQWISRLPGGDALAGLLERVLSAAWALATVFALPVLALEGSTPVDTVRRSVAVLRARWGEDIGGALATGVMGMITIGVPAAIAAAGYGLTRLHHAVAGSVLLGCGLVMLAVGWVLQSAIDDLFTLVLYRHATGAVLPAGFNDADVQAGLRISTKD